MRIKLDENIGLRLGEPLRAAGHDVASVAQQGMTNATDRTLIEACRKERRCLVTLDLEFGNPFLFDPSKYAGIAVLRLPRSGTPGALLACMKTLARALEEQPISGLLWVVQPGRVREYQQE
ncbi:MAG: DUF5615 family PIN-like protein [Planctomycetota bacterium]